jgi:hypothetical protein
MAVMAAMSTENDGDGGHDDGCGGDDGCSTVAVVKMIAIQSRCQYSGGAHGVIGHEKPTQIIAASGRFPHDS